jgi:hypothetical protein
MSSLSECKTLPKEEILTSNLLGENGLIVNHLC